MNETILNVSGLVRHFGERKAVDGVDLEVRRGEILGLLGPNGAGKSTTVHLILGQLAPDAGTITIEGEGGPRDAGRRGRLGVAPQALALYEELTGRENLTFFGRLHDLRGPALEDAVQAALDFVGLAERANERVKNWSGGMKRRLNLAGAILHDPVLVLLDEPTVGVDPQSRNAIFENILALRERGISLIYTTHYMEEAHRLCDRVAIMDHGKILDCDTVPELLRRHGETPVLRARVDGEERRIATEDPIGALGALREEGDLTSFRLEGSDLEAVFLKLTGSRLRDEA